MPGGLDEETPRHRGEGRVGEQAEVGMLQLDSTPRAGSWRRLGHPAQEPPEKRARAHREPAPPGLQDLRGCVLCSKASSGQ